MVGRGVGRSRKFVGDEIMAMLLAAAILVMMTLVAWSPHIHLSRAHQMETGGLTVQVATTSVVDDDLVTAFYMAALTVCVGQTYLDPAQAKVGG